MVDPPLPTQIHRLNIADSSEPIGSTNLINDLELVVTNTSTLEITRVEYPQVEGFVRPFNIPLIGSNHQFLIQVPISLEP